MHSLAGSLALLLGIMQRMSLFYSDLHLNIFKLLLCVFPSCCEKMREEGEKEEEGEVEEEEERV